MDRTQTCIASKHLRELGLLIAPSTLNAIILTRLFFYHDAHAVNGIASHCITLHGTAGHGTILSTETISEFFTGDPKPEYPAYPGRHAGPEYVYPAGS